MADSGKNGRRQLEAYDSLHGRTLSVDSREEVDAINWLCEAAELSAVRDFEYQPRSFELFAGADYVDADGKTRCLFRDHVYTPDFLVALGPSAGTALLKEFRVRAPQLSAPEVSVYWDVKGTFARHDGGRSFSLNQKWVWQKYGEYVYKMVPKAFFAKAGCPAKSFYSAKAKRERKAFAGMKSVKEALLDEKR